MQHKTLFESRFGIGDRVTLNFGSSGFLLNCYVEAPAFTADGKVLYDICIPSEAGDTVIHRVDSFFVHEHPELELTEPAGNLQMRDATPGAHHPKS